MVENLLDLSLGFGLSFQNLTSLDVQEAEGIDSVVSVEGLRLREGVFGVILRFLERDIGPRRILSQLPRMSKNVAMGSPRDTFSPSSACSILFPVSQQNSEP